MSRLVYGVGLASGAWRRPLPAGPLGLPTNLLCEGELAAAYSDFAVADPNPSASYLLAYAQVIEQLHRRGPFLPMRYACLLPAKDAISDVMRTRRREFLAMLEDVAGCDEFGLQIPAGAPVHRGGASYAPDASVSAEQAAGGQGACDFDGRPRYAQQDVRRAEAEQAAKRFIVAFQGLYVRCQQAAPAESDSMVSLWFLVRRQCQGRFCKMFGDLQRDLSDDLLLTGPRPPYHFAAISGAETATGLVSAGAMSAVHKAPASGESEP